MTQKRTSQLSLGKKFEFYFGLTLQLVVLMFLSRLVVDTSNRIFMPFLPQVASGLGLTLTAFSWILALRSLVGLTSPFIGMLADRFGRRLVMVSLQAIRGATLIGLSLSKGWWSLIPLVLLSLTTAAYMPVQRAYVSDIVRYDRRGRALAAIDASFSTAGILGLPLVGWMIEGWGWQLPFLVIGILCLVMAAITRIRLPKTTLLTSTSNMSTQIMDLIRQPNVIAAMVVSSFSLIIFIMFMISWSFLLHERFGFSPLKIGFMGTVIGIAELLGLLIAGIIIDQLGKRKGSLIGLAVSAVLFLAFPFFQNTLLTIQIVLVLITIAIEFSITATIPLFADQAPHFRATLFCLLSFGSTIGGGLAAPLTTWLWSWQGVSGVYISGGLITLISFFLVWKFLFDGSESDEVLQIGNKSI